MKTWNTRIGRMGEDLARKLLQEKGIAIIERNFHTRFGEIDLIGKDGDTLVFVEVKTKRGVGFGSPEDMYTKSKAARVRKMATIYLEGRDIPCRIDVVAVVLNPDNSPRRITYYPNVVYY